MKKQDNIKFFDAVEIDGYSYFSSKEYNCFFRKKKDSENVEYIGFFDSEDLDATALHINTINIGRKIYFIPFNGRSISVYDVDLNVIESFAVLLNEKISFSKAHIYNDEIILVPSNSKFNFMKFTTKENRISTIDRITDKIKEQLNCDHFNIDLYASYLDGDNLYISIHGKNVLYKINMKNNDFEYIEFPKIYKIKNFSIINDIFWFTLIDNYNIINYNSITKEIKEFFNESTGIMNEPYLHCIEFNDKIYVLPCLEDHIGVINLDTNKIKPVKKLINENCNRKVGSSSIVGYNIENNNITIYPNEWDSLLVIDTALKIDVIKLKFDQSFDNYVKIKVKNKINKSANENDIIIENSENYLTFENYLKFKIENKVNINSIKTNTIGEKIWNELRK